MRDSLYIFFFYKGSQLGQGPGGCGASGATTTKAKRAAATHTLNTPPAARAPLTYTRRAVCTVSLPFQAFSPFQVLASSVPVTERGR